MEDNTNVVAAQEVLNSTNETAPAKTDVVVKKPYHKKKKKPTVTVTSTLDSVCPAPLANATMTIQETNKVTPKVIILKQAQPNWFKKQYNSFLKWYKL